MNERFKQLSTRLILIWLLPLSLSLHSGCGGEADTVDPEAVTQSLPVTLTGTIYPQIISAYPADLSSDIPVDTDLVIVFSKPIDLATVSFASGNITITGVTGYNVNPASGGYAIVINVTVPPNLPFNILHTVNIGAGVADTDGYPISSTGSFSFTTAVDSSTVLRPRVINATRYPGAGVSGVSRVQPYVEVTFTESINPATVTVGSFSILPNIASGVATAVAGSSNKTWRLPLNTAAYGTPYTVTLTNAIQSAGGAALLDVAGNLIWTYTTELDPTLIPLTVDNIWVSAITDTTATINFTTSKPVARQNCYAVYITPPVLPPVTTAGTHFQESAVATLASTHSMTVTGLTPFTLYYFRGGIETAGGPPVEILSTSEISFYTGAGAGINTVLTNAAADQNGLQLLQTDGTGSYAFWVSNSSDIYGQFFNAAQLWPAGGSAISTPGVQDGIVAITDGFTDAIVVYKEGNNLYSKMIYNTGAAAGFRWGGAASSAAGQGMDLGITIKAGSAYSACIVHERPVIVSSGVADMPDDGGAADLLYDADVDFSSYNAWLDAGDLMLTNAWAQYTISNQIPLLTPYGIFPFILRSAASGFGLGAFANYYIVDTGLTVTQATGGADSLTSPTELRSTTNADLLLVRNGDIIHNMPPDNTWGIATADGEWFAAGPYYRVAIAGGVALLSDGDPFTIYRNHAGPFTSEAVTNPLWDTAPSTLFNPGVNVLAGDFVVNERDNVLGATNAAVLAIDLTRDTDYALRLSADIMDSGDVYSIVGLPTGAAGVAVGYSTSFAADFNLTDSHNPFGSVNPGDIVFNIDQNLSAMVTASAAGSLTLTADIFNAVNDKAAVYTKRGFLVAYVDAADFIRARAFNNADGSPLGAVFNVCTSGTNSNPVAVTDGAGNAIIFYEKGGDIYAKKVSAPGGFLWAAPADTAVAAGISVLAGYTIVQALPDRAIGTTGGAYLLAKNTAGNFQLMHVLGSTGAAASVSGVLTGYDPQMVVDTETGLINRAVIVYRAPHVAGVTYYHIAVVAYRFGAGVVWGPFNMSSNAVTYNCLQPSITLADNSTAAAEEIYVSWFDGRYFNPSGFSIFAQRLDNAGAVQWAANGIHVSAPASMGYDNALSMKLLYWNDGGSPYGVLPIWLDYRNKVTTGTDLYYQRIDNTGTFF